MHFLSKIKIVILCLVTTTFVGILATNSARAAQTNTSCGGTSTRIIKCEIPEGLPAITPIKELIRIAVIAMTAVIGVVATGGLAYAATIYSSARDSQAQVDQAKTIIRNIVVGILMYVFMAVLINWLIPGVIIG